MANSDQINNKPDQLTWEVKVIAEAHLDHWINDYFGGMIITHAPDGTTVMQGSLPDLSAVYGLMLRLRDSGVILVEARIKRATTELRTNPAMK